MKIYTIARDAQIQKVNMDIPPSAEMQTLPPALRGEWYPFQIYLKGKSGTLTEVRFTDMTSSAGGVLHGESFTVLQLSAITDRGKKEKRQWRIEDKAVLWAYAAIPEDVAAGTYSGEMCALLSDGDEVKAPFIIEVRDEVIQNHGFDNADSLSRIGWLNSDLAIDHTISKPYVPVIWNEAEREINILGRRIRMGKAGLPAEISTCFDWQNRLSEMKNAILDGEMQLCFRVDGKKEIFKDKDETVERMEDFVQLYCRANGEKTALSTRFRIEYDGYAEYFAELTAKSDLTLDDAELTVPFSKHACTYFVGLGYEGGNIPEKVDFKWDKDKHQDSFWVGNVNAGLKIQLRDAEYEKPNVNIYYPYKPLTPPKAWHNGGKGGIQIANRRACAYCGSRQLKKGETLTFGITLMITPLKPIDYEAHFKHRYYQKYSCEGTDNWLSEMEKVGANIINIHHATDLNPYINTPFFEAEALQEFSDKVHADGNLVKLYYTIRELSVYAAEFEVFRSLGYEIFQKSQGINGPSLWQPEAKKWIEEHYGDDLIPAWRQEITEGKYAGHTDAAVITNGQSRLCNYYIEGIRWLIEKCGIDGIYIDDVAYDRYTMQRARKVIDTKKNGLIDFHTWNHIDKRAGMTNSLNLYTELLPYIDDLWVGECFKYKTGSPAYWLAEISGVPYGLMSTMMIDGDFYKGLLYGESTRYGWRYTSESAWPLWDSFGITESKMFGYWNPENPVTTDNEKVLATCYVKKDKMLVCMASWAEGETEVSLCYKKNMDIKSITAPEIEGKQAYRSFAKEDPFSIPSNGGLVLEILIRRQTI